MKKNKFNALLRKSMGCLLSTALCFSAVTAIKGAEFNAVGNADDGIDYKLADSCQEGTILHCFSWEYKDVTASMRRIADAGFTSVQLSPIQPTPYGINNGLSWYNVYQPVDMKITEYDNEEEELKKLCREADKYGIKVIMDVVANHLVYISGVSPKEYARRDHWHNSGKIKDYTNRSNITNGDLLGLKDLNTENKDVQQKVINFMDELYNAGVDGIRWDAAKHIGLPSEGSDFWPSVLDKRMYNYGEIINGPVDTDAQYDLMKEYASMMSVTDSTYGEKLVSSFNQGKAPDAKSKWMTEGVSSDRLVFWGESHDTYSNGPDETGATTRMSQNTIDKAYAVAASREGATALYFSRPSETEKDKIICGQKGSTHFTSPEVSAVNHFHNAMNGKRDSITTENNCVVITRESGGAVIVCGDKGGQVTVPNSGGYAAEGTYYDEVSGNSFTVTDKTITGTVGESGIAVVYDSNFLGHFSADSNGKEKFYKSLDITLGTKGIENTEYEISGTDENGNEKTEKNSFSDGDVITIGEGFADESVIRLTLTGTAVNGKARKEIHEYNIGSFYRTIPYDIAQRWSNCTFVFDNFNTKWDEVYFYAYSKDGDTIMDNAAYPGEKMKDEGEEFYSYILSDKFKDKEVFVIFNDGKGANISESLNSVNHTKYPYGVLYTDRFWIDCNGVSHIAPTGHNHTIIYNEKVDPTETEPGMQAYYSCTDCEKVFSDPAGLYEADPEELVIPPTGHSGSDESSADESSAEEGSTDESSAEESSTDESSTDESSTDESSSDESSAEESSADESSTDESSTDESSSDESSPDESSTEESNTEESSSEESDSVPKTGDNALCTVLAFVALITASSIILIFRRKNREK